MTILCCGEALIDMLPRETAAGEEAFAPYPGGSVFNTAIALGRLGAETAFFSGLSTDHFGTLLRRALEASEVDAAPAALSERPTTLAFVRLVNGQARYMFYDENTAGRMIAEADLPPSGADALFFGGISLVVEPCGAAYEALQAREAPARVTMLDPNIRPTFITDEVAYRARMERMIARADIVKISDEDLRWLSGDAPLERLAEEMLAAGPKLVCVTEGAKGVTGYHASGAVFVEAEEAEVVDTVGAGDTFNAGVLASLAGAELLSKPAVAALGEADIRAALELGAKAAAVVVARAGANPPWARELA
ncbi:carbohydrate kinase family protein [Pseudoroseicyclus tamaricis]|uniref:Carbohydrate kinase n=1 Tax=Pseudoroseicyclus tamaricis TaxID=2705421 RepID=A0A6B2K1V0_9RHOB|nr:carbohydrate kinase [Pseudoroseicyclus tamaricis]NDV02474.1 carbohydrate kinase [Pseudoroseicyclus tamaricis]